MKIKNTQEKISSFDLGFSVGYDEGFQPCEFGPRPSNPFTEGSDDHSQWESGFIEGFDLGYSEH